MPSYIDSQQFERAVIASQELGQPTAALGRGVLLIAQGIARRNRFRHYQYRDDLISAGVLKALQVYKQYQPARGGAFTWFTSVITNAFLSHIRAEQRQRTLAAKWGAFAVSDVQD